MKQKMSVFDLENPVFLGPMAGVTDLPFRLLCKEMGCSFLYTEMISAKALYYKNKNTIPLLMTKEEEMPIAVQLFGSEPELMADMAKTLEDKGFAAIDINMGCPVPKIVNNGEGSALMKNPVLAGKIIEAVNNAVSLPVTVKIRRGFDEEHCNAVEMAKIAQESGASAIAVHGRTRAQYYSGKADWDIIRQVKEAVEIPVIGNGDVASADDYIAMRQQTGCDGVMIARAAKGNPWIFRHITEQLRQTATCGYGEKSDAEKMKQAVSYSCDEKNDAVKGNNHSTCDCGEKTGEKQSAFLVENQEQTGNKKTGNKSGFTTKSGMIQKPNLEEVIDMIKRHTELMIQYKGEYTAIREMRKHIAWYTVGYPASAKLRDAVNQTSTRQQLMDLLDRYLYHGK